MGINKLVNAQNCFLSPNYLPAMCLPAHHVMFGNDKPFIAQLIMAALLVWILLIK